MIVEAAIVIPLLFCIVFGMIKISLSLLTKEKEQSVQNIIVDDNAIFPESILKTRWLLENEE